MCRRHERREDRCTEPLWRGAPLHPPWARRAPRLRPRPGHGKFPAVMSGPALVVFLDYVDPFSYLLEPALRRLEDEDGVEVRRQPFELHAPVGRLPDPNAPERIRQWRDEVEPLARELGTVIRRPRLIPWTRKAHELARFAASRGRFREVHEALFRAHFVEGRDIGRIDVLVTIGAAAGLPLTDTKVTLDVDACADHVAAAREEAARLGVHRVPTILAGGRRLAGYQPYERLLALVTERERA